MTMSFLNWRSEYSVGSESVDYEHQQMIALINAIYDEMHERKDVDSIEQFLGDVHAAISAHFALEEREMQRSSYAEYAAHKEDHEDLLDQLRSMMDDVQANPAHGITKLQERLGAWFEQHFSTFDARLHGKLESPRH
ncbi:MAG: hemerythrin [Woeseiaceae bacterium]|jgi:hemerythrin